MSDKGNKLTEQLSQAWAITRARITPLKLMICAAILVTAFLICWGWEGFVSCDIDQRGAAFRNFGLPILAVWGICLAVWRSTTAQRQADTTAQQANTAVRSLQNDRYQRGAEMLGSSEFPVRVGGVQALAQLARDEPETYHRQIMALFASFALHPTPDDSLKQALEELPKNQDQCRPDIEAIVQSIGARTKQQLGLDHPATHPATGHESAASIELKKADLRGALLRDAILSQVSFFGVNLCKANLTRANLTNANIESTNFTEAILTEANLTNANISDAKLTNAFLSYANLSDAALLQVDLTKACLHNADLTYAKASGANLTGAGLSKANLAHAGLFEADLTGADLTRADLNGAALTLADLNGADLTLADLNGADLTLADLNGADLKGVKNLTQDQLNKACQHPQGNSPINIPSGLKWNEGEAIERWKEAHEDRTHP